MTLLKEINDTQTQDPSHVDGIKFNVLQGSEETAQEISTQWFPVCPATEKYKAPNPWTTR